jgi:hypothetical protein
MHSWPEKPRLLSETDPSTLMCESRNEGKPPHTLKSQSLKNSRSKWICGAKNGHGLQSVKSNRNHFVGTAIHNRSLTVGTNPAIMRFSMHKLRGLANRVTCADGLCWRGFAIRNGFAGAGGARRNAVASRACQTWELQCHRICPENQLGLSYAVRHSNEKVCDDSRFQWPGTANATECTCTVFRGPRPGPSAAIRAL